MSRKRTKARKAKRPPAPARSKRSRPPEPAIVVVNLGQAVAIEYRREKDGRTYRHQFGNGVGLHRTRDGKQLIVSPVKAGDFIRG